MYLFITLIIFLIFARCSNGNEKIVAYDWETGEELTKEMLKNRQLFVRKNNGLLTFNANKNGITEPIQLPFNPEFIDSESMCRSEAAKWFELDLKICLRRGSSCKDGCAICYVSKMDPANRPLLLDHLKVQNLPQNSSDLCKNKDFKGWERKTLHGIFLKADGGTGRKIELSASFSSERQILALDEWNCATIKIAVDDASKLGEKYNVWTHLAQAGDLAELPIQKILPFDIFADFKGTQEPLLAFAGTDGCSIEISINDPMLSHCTSKKCEHFISPYKAKFELEHLKPVRTHRGQAFIQSEYARNVVFQQDVNGKRSIWIGGNGEEIVFGILTKTPEPPSFTVPYPAYGKFCTVHGDYKLNKFMFAYNGDERCFIHFAWQKDALFVFAENKTNVKIESQMEAVTINVVNSHGFTTFRPDVNEKNQAKNNVVKANCPMDGIRIETPFDGLPEHVFLWQFVLNPEKIVWEQNISKSTCPLGIEFNLDEYVLMLPEDYNENEE